MRLSRRTLCKILIRGLGLAPAAGVRGIARAELRVDSLRFENPLPVRSCGSRAYRADVGVSVLGVPIFSRSAVGSALMVFRESCAADLRAISLHFAGGSNPERAHGVNYSGSLEEAAIERGSTLIEAANFSFITASPEEGYADARQRVLAKGPAPAAYIAVEGLHRNGRVSNSRACVTLPDQPGTERTGQAWPELIGQVRSLFLIARVTQSEFVLPGATPKSFLYSILAAVRSPESVFTCEYVHNGRLYQLECVKSPDRHTGDGFVSKNLTSFPKSVIRLTGRTRDPAKGHTSTFRLWLEQGSDYPLRIEFQPRSYLRIVLESDPTLEVPIKPKEAV